LRRSTRSSVVNSSSGKKPKAKTPKRGNNVTRMLILN
jgi:hypothetical protein